MMQNDDIAITSTSSSMENVFSNGDGGVDNSDGTGTSTHGNISMKEYTATASRIGTGTDTATDTDTGTGTRISEQQEDLGFVDVEMRDIPLQPQSVQSHQPQKQQQQYQQQPSTTLLANDEDGYYNDAYSSQRPTSSPPLPPQQPPLPPPPLQQKPQQAHRQLSTSSTTIASINSTTNSPKSLTNQDISTIQRLDAEYEQALLEREIGWNAQYISVRQNAGMSIWFMILFLTIGTIFFDYNTEWDLGESLLFSIYTITTVGYGRHVIPDDDGVLIFISVYIFLGIATLTIMAAQLYQWVVLEVTWARYEHDKNELTKKHSQNMVSMGVIEGVDNDDDDGGGHLDIGMIDLSEDGEVRVRRSCTASALDGAVMLLNKVQDFVKDYAYGQLVVVMVPFWFLICLGALVIGSIEGWGLVQSFYFSVVSLTTVGYGDFYPDKTASRWFCILWLPFSVFFVSLYLGSVASFYIELSAKNVKRIERKLRRRMDRVKTWQEKEREEARLRGTSGGFDFHAAEEEGEEDTTTAAAAATASTGTGAAIPSHIQSAPTIKKDKRGFASVSLDEDDMSPRNVLSPSSKKRTINRRNEILTKSGSTRPSIQQDESGHSAENMKTMADVITAIKLNRSSSRRTTAESGSSRSGFAENDVIENQEFLNVESRIHYNTAKGIAKKPSFALRVIVQERLAQIVAYEVAGYQSNVEIKSNTLSVTIDSLKHTCEKWLIPRRATKSFRSVAFETLYFVGERQLIVRGADAVFELRPAEVQGLFGPVLAAMGDAGTMEAWLSRTQSLAETELQDRVNDAEFKFNLIDDRRVNQISQNMTANPKTQRTVIGNAFSNN